MSILISAKRHNWGQININTDWHKMSFDVTSDADLTIRLYRFQQVFTSKTKIDSKDFDEIVKLMESIIENQPQDRIDACDGEAWSITVYGKGRKKLYVRELGYTYGIDELERLEDILVSYMPDDLTEGSNVFLGPF